MGTCKNRVHEESRRSNRVRHSSVSISAIALNSFQGLTEVAVSSVLVATEGTGRSTAWSTSSTGKSSGSAEYKEMWTRKCTFSP